MAELSSDSSVHPEKVLGERLPTGRESGMLIEESEVHPLNADLPISLSPSGRTTEERAVQPQNEYSPISVSPSGRTTEESAVQH